MTREEAIQRLKEFKSASWDGMPEEVIDVAIEALEQISHLKGRPCEVCEYHTGNGCSEWECVFKGV